MNSIKHILSLLSASLICLVIAAALGALSLTVFKDNPIGFFFVVVALIFFLLGITTLSENISEVVRLAKISVVVKRKLKGKKVKQYKAKICGREIISSGSFNVIVRYFDHRGWKKEAWIRLPNTGRMGEEYRVGGTVHIKADDERAEFDKEQPQITEEEIEWQDRLMKEDLTCYHCKKPVRMTSGTVSQCPSCGQKIVLPSIRSYIFRPEDNPSKLRRVKVGDDWTYETEGEEKKEAAGLLSSLVIIIVAIVMICTFIKSEDNPLLRIMLIISIIMLGKGLLSLVSAVRDMKFIKQAPRFRGKIFRYERAMWDFVDGIPMIVPVVRYFDKMGHLKETTVETGSIVQDRYAIGNTVEIETPISGSEIVKWNYPLIKHFSLHDEDRLMDALEKADFSGKRNGPCRSDIYDENAEPDTLVCPTCGQELEVQPGAEAGCSGCGGKLAYTFDRIAIWESQTII